MPNDNGWGAIRWYERGILHGKPGGDMISTESTEHLAVGTGGLDLTFAKAGECSYTNRERFEFRPQQACTSIVIMGEDGEVGRLSWDTGSLAFSGDMAESAQIFFDDFLKPFVDEYIRAQGNPVPPPV